MPQLVFETTPELIKTLFNHTTELRISEVFRKKMAMKIYWNVEFLIILCFSCNIFIPHVELIRYKDTILSKCDCITSISIIRDSIITPNVKICVNNP